MLMSIKMAITILMFLFSRDYECTQSIRDKDIMRKVLLLGLCLYLSVHFFLVLQPHTKAEEYRLEELEKSWKSSREILGG